MTALEPGLYKATVFGKPDVTVMVDDRGLGHLMVETFAGTYLVHHVSSNRITDARPLIVLDLHPTVAEDLVVAMRDSTQLASPTVYQLTLIRKVADAIEAQTKPARIEEPSLWGVVKAGWPDNLGPTCHWVRDEYGWATHGGTTLPWGRLVDPVLVRAGVNS